MRSLKHLWIFFIISSIRFSFSCRQSLLSPAAPPAAPGAVTAAAAFPVFLIIVYDQNSCCDSGKYRQKNNDICNIHIHPPGSQSDGNADIPDDKCCDPGNCTLPEDHADGPPCSQLSLNDSNGSDTRCIQKRKYQHGCCRDR